MSFGAFPTPGSGRSQLFHRFDSSPRHRVTLRRSPRPVEQAHLPAKVSPRRRATLALLSTLAASGALLLTATPALAKEFHSFKTSFAGEGANALSNPTDVAVDDETGDVYVTEAGNSRVEEFKPDGTFLRSFPAADPTYIAIDNSTGASKGDVYVADSTTDTVSKFTSAGAPISGWGAAGQLSGSAATGTGTLSAATGTGDTSAATGTGDLSAASKTLTALTTSSGTFAEGQEISAQGIEPGTTVAKILSPTELELSAPATEEATATELSAASKTLTALTTSSGAFAVGQEISGTGIPGGATVAAIPGPGELELSAPATEAVTATELSAASKEITALTTSSGAFAVGQTIEATGIPAGTTVAAIPGPGSLELSAPPSASGPQSLSAAQPFGSLDGIAVDSSGTLYVLAEERHLLKFTPEGAFTESFEAVFGASPVGIAVDGEGDIYKARGSGTTAKLGPTGEALNGEVDTEPATGLAVDPSNNDLYVAHATEVARYGSAGERLEGFGPPEIGAAAGIAVGPGHTVYVADDADQRIDVFTAAPGIPLTVAVTGPGSVSADQGAISGCTEAGGPSCEDQFPKGKVITLTESHAERVSFDGWSGCESEANGGTECTVSLAAATEVKAEFTAIPQEALTVSEPGTGLGGLTGTSPGPEFTPLECGNGGSICTETYNQGATVILTATRATHSEFTAWSGCPHVLSSARFSPSRCEVPAISAATEVKAEFTAIPQANLELITEGSGEVTSAPPGIACTSASSPCTEHFDTEGPETTVTLTATPAPDNHLGAWEGCEALNGPECTVTLSAAKSVKAVFVPTLHTVTLTPSGPGSVSAPSGITGCEEGGGTCAAGFQEGSALTLTASPHEHDHVTWSGCKRAHDPDECKVEIGTTPLAVTAAFSPNLQTLTVAPTGPGEVSAGAGPISGCTRGGGGTCAGEYGETSTVLLTATPAPHYHLKAWSGEGCSGTGSCEVAIGASPAEVKAEFAPNTQTLAVTATGQGSLRATSGVIRECSEAGGTCAGTYIEAATVTLTASPAPHQAVAWQGCTAVPSANRCEVEIGASTTAVKASFAQIADTLSIAKAGTGSGSVACDGAPCAAAYPEGAALTLTATPAAGSTFAGWSGGGCAGTGPCHLTIEAATAITASFDANPPPPAEERCLVPALAGKTLGQASSALAAAHCSLGKLTKPKKKKGHKPGPLLVKSSSPAAGTALAAGGKVNLTLGPKPKKKH
jgi:DNA-binding beta-propeller fold protein YncE